jgi:hypothetical protein
MKIKVRHARLAALAGISVIVVAIMLAVTLFGSVETASARPIRRICKIKIVTATDSPVGTDSSVKVVVCKGTNLGNCTFKFSEGCFADVDADGQVGQDLGCQVKLVCPNESEEEPPVGCGIWEPDVGDADELGLIATDGEVGHTILVGVEDAETGEIIPVAELVYPFSGHDFWQVPEEYQSDMYWFQVNGCGRWHNAAEVGLLD